MNRDEYIVALRGMCNAAEFDRLVAKNEELRIHQNSTASWDINPVREGIPSPELWNGDRKPENREWMTAEEGMERFESGDNIWHFLDGKIEKWHIDCSGLLRYSKSARTPKEYDDAHQPTYVMVRIEGEQPPDPPETGLEKAANELCSEYKTNKELTAFTALDGEDFYEGVEMNKEEFVNNLKKFGNHKYWSGQAVVQDNDYSFKEEALLAMEYKEKLLGEFDCLKAKIANHNKEIGVVKAQRFEFMQEITRLKQTIRELEGHAEQLSASPIMTEYEQVKTICEMSAHEIRKKYGYNQRSKWCIRQLAIWQNHEKLWSAARDAAETNVQDIFVTTKEYNKSICQHALELADRG